MEPFIEEPGPVAPAESSTDKPPVLLWPVSLVVRWADGSRSDHSQYTLGDALGKGGFGEVRAATKQGVPTPLAVKIFKGQW